MEEQQPQSHRTSTRSFEEWKAALINLAKRQLGVKEVIVEDKNVKPYYDQGLMPDVCFRELFNK